MPDRTMTAAVVRFCRLLRANGLAIGPREETDALRALQLVELVDPQQFRRALRAILARSRRDQLAFDALFDGFWSRDEDAGGLPAPGAAAADGESDADDRRPGRSSLLGLTDLAAEDSDEPLAGATYSALEALGRKDFGGMSASQLAEAMALVDLIARRLARRLSRRQRIRATGQQPDLRRTLRDNLRHGGELLELRRRRRRLRKLRLVLVLDVSQSMDVYSAPLLQFVYAFQSLYRSIETFVFSTQLRRISEVLKRHEFGPALLQLSQLVPEWSGGTRIGQSLQTLTTRYAACLRQQPVVLIMSDGWDTGEIDELETAMAELRRRASRLFWLNPLCGSRDYEPTCRGMAAALPYVDVLASAHNLDSLRQLAQRLSRH